MSEWPLLPGVNGAARFDGDDHRLWLERYWDNSFDAPFALHIGMNPSMAGKDRDDLTVRKDQEFTRRMGLSRMFKCNIGTLVSTDPNGLHGVSVVCHQDNLSTIFRLAGGAARIVVATGNLPDPLIGYARTIFRELKRQGLRLECFGLTKNHWPKHSSRLGYDTPLQEFLW